jgi:nucleoid-associated protein YgaU
MSSYYKKINGKNYDRAMIEIAEKSIAGKGDGRISLADSKKIVKQMQDGGRITDIERRTISYILEKYSLTETAINHIEKVLSEQQLEEIHKESEVKINEAVTAPQKEKNTETRSFSFNKILLILIIIIFIVFIIFRLFFRTENGKNIIIDNKDENLSVSDNSAESKNVISDNKDEQISVSEKLPLSKKTDPDIFDDRGRKINESDDGRITAEKTAGDNRYIVKDKDTLIRISEELYGDYKKWGEIYRLNREKISNPDILYPGQVLVIPQIEKK